MFISTYYAYTVLSCPITNRHGHKDITHISNHNVLKTTVFASKIMTQVITHLLFIVTQFLSNDTHHIGIKHYHHCSVGWLSPIDWSQSYDSVNF